MNETKLETRYVTVVRPFPSNYGERELGIPVLGMATSPTLHETREAAQQAGEAWLWEQAPTTPRPSFTVVERWFPPEPPHVPTNPNPSGITDEDWQQYLDDPAGADSFAARVAAKVAQLGLDDALKSRELQRERAQTAEAERDLALQLLRTLCDALQEYWSDEMDAMPDHFRIDYEVARGHLAEFHMSGR